jgi:hypothetical protein
MATRIINPLLPRDPPLEVLIGTEQLENENSADFASLSLHFP